MGIETPYGMLTVRPEGPEDEDFRFALFAQSRPDLLLIPEPTRAGILAMQFRAQSQGYRRQFPSARFDIVELNGQPAGRIARDDAGGFLHLIDIALPVQLRNRGLGTAVLTSLMQEARVAGMPMRLSVAFGNPAARLYERLGFVAIANRGTDIEMEWRPRG